MIEFWALLPPGTGFIRSVFFFIKKFNRDIRTEKPNSAANTSGLGEVFRGQTYPQLKGQGV